MKTIERAEDPAFREACALTTQVGRATAGRYQVEGERLVRQALAAGVLTGAFLIGETGALASELATAGVDTGRLPERLLPRLIGTRYATAVEAVGVVVRKPLAACPTTGLLLACEALQDPRNVGVLIRTAEAVGAAAVLLSDDGADPYSRPAVRSSTGSILRQPVCLTGALPAELSRLRAAGVRVVGTSAHTERTCWSVDLRGEVAIVLGNESTGLSDELLAVCDATVRLPVHGGCSSLNVTVAAGAILYEALRQRSS